MLLPTKQPTAVLRKGSDTPQTPLLRVPHFLIGPITRPFTLSAASSKTSTVPKQWIHISSAISTKIHRQSITIFSKLKTKPQKETYAVPLSVMSHSRYPCQISHQDVMRSLVNSVSTIRYTICRQENWWHSCRHTKACTSSPAAKNNLETHYGPP